MTGTMRTVRARRDEVWGFLRALGREARRYPLTMMAASISFFALFSLPSLLLMVIGLAAVAFDSSQAQAQIVEQARTLAGRDGARMVETIIEQGLQREDGGPMPRILGLLALFLGATGVFIQLQDVLNAMWRTNPVRRHMGIVRVVIKRVLSLGILLAIGFLLVVSLALSAVMGLLGEALTAHVPTLTTHVLMAGADLLVSFVLATVLFGAIFKFLPDTPVAWRQVWVGAATTAWLLLIARWLVGFYLGQSDLGSAYGRAGSLAVLLIWLYAASAGLLVGAVVTRVHAEVYQREMGVSFRLGEGQRALPLAGEEPEAGPAPGEDAAPAAPAGQEARAHDGAPAPASASDAEPAGSRRERGR